MFYIYIMKNIFTLLLCLSVIFVASDSYANSIEHKNFTEQSFVDNDLQCDNSIDLAVDYNSNIAYITMSVVYMENKAIIPTLYSKTITSDHSCYSGKACKTIYSYLIIRNSDGKLNSSGGLPYKHTYTLSRSLYDSPSNVYSIAYNT